MIHPSFSRAGLAALAVEVKMFCAEEQPGVRFDFAEVLKLDVAVLVLLNSFMYELHQDFGRVKVTASNEKLILLVKNEQMATEKLAF